MLKNCLSYFLFMFLFYYCCRTKTCGMTGHMQKTTLPLVLRELFYILSKSNIFYFVNQLKQLIVFYPRCLTYFKIFLVRTVYVTSWKLKSTSWNSKLRVQIHELRVWIHKCTSSNPRVTSPNSRVTSSNLRVTSLNPRIIKSTKT